MTTHLPSSSPLLVGGCHRRRQCCLLWPLLIAAVGAAIGTSAAQALQTEKVILVVIDGARATEFFEEPNHEFIPHIWNDLRPAGYVSHDFWNLYQSKTVVAHASILTGTNQDIDPGGAERPCLPTMFEYLRDQIGLPAEKALLVIYKQKLLNLSHSTYAGYGAEDSAMVIGPLYNDALCIERFIEHAELHEPVLSVIALGHVDVMGHECEEFSWYTGAIREADGCVGTLWEWVQSHPAYADRTTMLVTADHGRHTVDWCEHGDDCEGCLHVPLAAIGPDIVANYEDSSHPGEHRDICATVAALLGFDAYWVQGRVLTEIFRDPAGIAAERSGWSAAGCLTASSPALKASFVRLVLDVSLEIPNGSWRATLYDIAGRKLGAWELSTARLKEGWLLSRPGRCSGAGVSWLEMRPLDPVDPTSFRTALLWLR